REGPPVCRPRGAAGRWGLTDSRRNLLPKSQIGRFRSPVEWPRLRLDVGHGQVRTLLSKLTGERGKKRQAGLGRNGVAATRELRSGARTFGQSRTWCAGGQLSIPPGLHGARSMDEQQKRGHEDGANDERIEQHADRQREAELSQF